MAGLAAHSTSTSNEFDFLSGTFETPSASIFKKREQCFVRLDDKGVNVYKKEGDKKPKKSFVFDEVEKLTVEKHTEKGAFSFVISDQKKEEIVIFTKTEQEMAKFAEGIVNNKLSFDVTKRKKSLMKVTEEGKRFDKIWDNDSDEEDGEGNVKTLQSAGRKSIAINDLPPENEGWVMKQGGLIKNWKNRYFVLDCFQMKYYKSENITNEKPKGEISIDEKCSVKPMKQGKKSKKKGAFGFELYTPGRTYQLMCQSQEELATWMFKIKLTISMKTKMQKKSANLQAKQSTRNMKELAAIKNEAEGHTDDMAKRNTDVEDLDGTQKILVNRIEQAKLCPWNRRAKSNIYFNPKFTNARDGWVQAELSFKLENLAVIAEKDRGKASKDAKGKVVNSVYLVLSESPFFPMRVNREHLSAVEQRQTLKYTPIFRTDVVHDSRNPEFLFAALMDLPEGGDRAIRVDVYVTVGKNNDEKQFGSAKFTISDVLREVVSLPVRLESKFSENTLMHVRYESGHNSFDPKISECWGLMASTQIYRNPQFRNRVLVREECWETATTFQVPLLYIKLRLAELVAEMVSAKKVASRKLHKAASRKSQLVNELKAMEAKLSDAGVAGATKSQLKKNKFELEKRSDNIVTTGDPRDLKYFQLMFKEVKTYCQCVDLLNPLYKSIPKNAYKNKKISFTFKPSKDKKKKSMQMLPTNLHAQIIFVGKPEKDVVGGVNKLEKRSRGSVYLDYTDEPEDTGLMNTQVDEGEGVGENCFFGFPTQSDGIGSTAYEIITFGAAAAHCQSFKKGGLVSWKKKLLELRGKGAGGLGSKLDANSPSAENNLVGDVKWVYQGDGDVIHGPFDNNQMRMWYQAEYFAADLMMALDGDGEGAKMFKPLGTYFEPGKEFVYFASSKLAKSRSVRTYSAVLDGDDMAALVGKMSDDEEEDEEEDENIEDMTDFEKQLKATQVMIAIQRREDFCICQSLSALVFSLSIKLELVARAKDPGSFFRQLEKVGYLFSCESLVSTQGPEQGMLEDYFEAMKALNQFQFRLQKIDMGSSVEASWQTREALTTLRLKMGALEETSEEYKEKAGIAQQLEDALNADSSDTIEKVWCFLDNNATEQGPFSTFEMREWYAEYPDLIHDEVKVRHVAEAPGEYLNIKERFPNGNPFTESSMAAVRVGKGIHQVMMERTSGNKIIVTLTVLDELFAMLPVSLQNGGLVSVCPVLFQQGINEFQSIANQVGGQNVKFQNVVNKHAFQTLKVYQSRVEREHDYIGYDADQIKFHNEKLAVLKEQVDKEDPRRKNVAILAAASCCVRMLKGGRGTNCKSAKDRTSMSVTLEQSRLIYYNHIHPHVPVRQNKTTRDLSEEDRCVLWMANEQRRQGIRIQNAKKNQGKMKFAFNGFQRGQLPKMYRPPRECIGKTET